MSTELLDETGVVVTQYARPDQPPMGGYPFDRRGYQVAVWNPDLGERQVVSFTRAQWVTLTQFMSGQCCR